ncbi:hypothetical protein MNBD_GAMMA16-2016 [hydrothermal vent metagenome]|uniref:Bacteriocin n=1 Tax=hydrothermal vent metagenome TaxID=652676 RepID=A0A3B0ZL67_9ZZZZ
MRELTFNEIEEVSGGYEWVNNALVGSFGYAGAVFGFLRGGYPGGAAGAAGGAAFGGGVYNYFSDAIDNAPTQQEYSEWAFQQEIDWNAWE